jgi:hypothetical protein
MKHKRHFIILDANSTVGAMYASGSNDGFTSDGEVNHPVIDCTEIVIDNPYYILATRSLEKEGGSYQSLYLPHGSVVAIYQYNPVEPLPFGFVPS